MAAIIVCITKTSKCSNIICILSFQVKYIVKLPRSGSHLFAFMFSWRSAHVFHGILAYKGLTKVFHGMVVGRSLWSLVMYNANVSTRTYARNYIPKDDAKYSKQEIWLIDRDNQIHRWQNRYDTKEYTHVRCLSNIDNDRFIRYIGYLAWLKTIHPQSLSKC